MADKPLVRNAANPSQVAEAAKRSHQARRREIDDVAFILSTRQGRRFFYRYLDICWEGRSPFSTAMNQAFFNLGEHNIGLRLKADLNEAAPETYALMLKEHREDESTT